MRGAEEGTYTCWTAHMWLRTLQNIFWIDSAFAVSKGPALQSRSGDQQLAAGIQV
jgi:hypothetical protein